MSTIVDYGQRLFALGRVFANDLVVAQENLFDFVHTEVLLFHDIVAVVFKTVGLDLLFEELDVVLNMEEIFEAFLFRLAFIVDPLFPADRRVIEVAKDEALSFVWAEVGHSGFLLFAEH